jgi:chorismate-pyruvate lyase
MRRASIPTQPAAAQPQGTGPIGNSQQKRATQKRRSSAVATVQLNEVVAFYNFYHPLETIIFLKELFNLINFPNSMSRAANKKNYLN